MLLLIQQLQFYLQIIILKSLETLLIYFEPMVRRREAGIVKVPHEGSKLRSWFHLSWGQLSRNAMQSYKADIVSLLKLQCNKKELRL